MKTRLRFLAAVAEPAMAARIRRDDWIFMVVINGGRPAPKTSLGSAWMLILVLWRTGKDKPGKSSTGKSMEVSGSKYCSSFVEGQPDLEGMKKRVKV